MCFNIISIDFLYANEEKKSIATIYIKLQK
jgi:hypothetical protein